MEVHSMLSHEELRILHQYHQKMNNSKTNRTNKEDSENESVYSHIYRSQSPLKVLQTNIFNDSQTVFKPQQPKVIIKQKRSFSTPKKNKASSNTTSNSSKGSLSNKNSSRNNSAKRTKKPRQVCTVGKTLDFTKMPNWKYEVSKLIRTVYRHSVLCSNFKEDSAKLGGLKILDEYKKLQES